jgi:ABC-2 type transport system permease protein
VRRELAHAFDSAVAPVALSAAIVATNATFLNEFFLTGKLDLAPLFALLPWVLALLCAALGMRLWSEDLRHGTFELWRTLPLSTAQVVLGKYAAAQVLVLLYLAGTLPLVAMLTWLGSPDLGAIAAGYLGALLLALELLALAAFAGSRTREQVAAFLAAALAGFALLALGDARVASVLDGLAPELAPGSALAGALSPLPHLERCARGFVPLAFVLHALLVSAALLALNVWSVREERA